MSHYHHTKIGVEKLSHNDIYENLSIPGQESPSGTAWRYLCPERYNLVHDHSTSATATCVKLMKGPLTYQCPEDWQLRFQNETWECLRQVTIGAEVICPEGYSRYFRSCLRSEYSMPDSLACPPFYHLQHNDHRMSNQQVATCVKSVYTDNIGLICKSPTDHLFSFPSSNTITTQNLFCFDFDGWSAVAGLDRTDTLGDAKEHIPLICNRRLLERTERLALPYTGLLMDMKLPQCVSESVSESSLTLEHEQDELLWLRLRSHCNRELACLETEDFVLKLPKTACPPGYFDGIEFPAILDDPFGQAKDDSNPATIVPSSCTALAVTETIPSCGAGWSPSEDGSHCVRHLSATPKVLCPGNYVAVGPSWPAWSKYITGDDDPAKDKDKDQLPHCRGTMKSPAMPVCEPGFALSEHLDHCYMEIITPPSIVELSTSVNHSDYIIPCLWNEVGNLSCTPEGVEDGGTIHTKGYRKGFQGHVF